MGASEVDALLEEAIRADDRMDVDDEYGRKHGSRAAPSSRPTPDLDYSMPPPQRPAKKKKESKTATTKKLPAKPKAKAAPRAKKTKSSEDGPASVPSKRLTNGTSRSRSTSAIPGGVDETELDPKSDHDKEDDDKLYCFCNTPYDEDKVMIACDRCDEWYHPRCVGESEVGVDLVDQFICPLCIEKNPHLPLHTTYKRRCLYGTASVDPDSPKACHKPARGALSKYCSDDCGVKYMQLRIGEWTAQGGDKDQLWQTIKNAERREGVVVLAGTDQGLAEDWDERAKRETKGMEAVLERILKTREQIEQGMDALANRERLLDLAILRAEEINQCGWDHRLCFGDDEWSHCGDIWTNYGHPEDPSKQDDPDKQWWCTGHPDCKRHVGWQMLRRGEMGRERVMKQKALENLTKREREVRGRIEDALDPQTRIRNQTIKVPLGENTPSALSTQPNGERKRGIGRKRKP